MYHEPRHVHMFCESCRKCSKQLTINPEPTTQEAAALSGRELETQSTL